MKNELEGRTKKFALEVIRFVSSLPPNRNSDVLGRQLLRSGTSIGANYREANRAQSKDDFIHKLALCEKEAAETEYWLELFGEAELASEKECKPLAAEAGELLAIFVASGRTSRARR